MPGMKPPTIMTPFIGGTIKVGHIIDNWPEILRLATSIKAGTTTASSILKSLSAYPRQNGLAKASVANFESFWIPKLLLA